MAKILLVEDDQSLREIYGIRLTAEGYEIVSAGDGEEALATAVREMPDLIISDVMMPKISGFDMLDILRSTPETKDIKVIMMTALSSEDQRERGESLGADRFLVKSQVGIEDVVNAVHEVLDQNNNTAANISTESAQVGEGQNPALAQASTSNQTSVQTQVPTQNQPSMQTQAPAQNQAPIQALTPDLPQSQTIPVQNPVAGQVPTQTQVVAQTQAQDPTQTQLKSQPQLQPEQNQSQLKNVPQSENTASAVSPMTEINQNPTTTAPTQPTDAYTINTVTDESGMNIKDQMDQILGGMGTV